MGIKFKTTFIQESKKVGKFVNNLKVLSVEQDKELEDFLMKKSRVIRDDIIESMRKTPKAPWSYKRGKKVHHPSMPFNPPAIDGGALWTHIDFNPVIKKPEFGVELGTDLKYGEWLEDGTENMDERPWLVPAVEREEPAIVSGIERITKINVDQAFKVLRKD